VLFPRGLIAFVVQCIPGYLTGNGRKRKLPPAASCKQLQLAVAGCNHRRPAESPWINSRGFAGFACVME
jgi:hypothetical protein